jgi:hypothetical protein
MPAVTPEVMPIMYKAAHAGIESAQILERSDKYEQGG